MKDEHIKQLAVKHGFKLTNEAGDDLKPYVYEFARNLIALAQQIKPLEFVQDSVGDLVAKSTMGNFYVLKMILSGFVYNGKPYKTEAEAIAAANEDYQRRVLSCLVWGVV